MFLLLFLVSNKFSHKNYHSSRSKSGYDVLLNSVFDCSIFLNHDEKPHNWHYGKHIVRIDKIIEVRGMHLGC